MPLYEIVKADGTREKVEADFWLVGHGGLQMKAVDIKGNVTTVKSYAPGTWLEVWRREGVGE